MDILDNFKEIDDFMGVVRSVDFEDWPTCRTVFQLLKIAPLVSYPQAEEKIDVLVKKYGGTSAPKFKTIGRIVPGVAEKIKSILKDHRQEYLAYIKNNDPAIQALRAKFEGLSFIDKILDADEESHLIEDAFSKGIAEEEITQLIEEWLSEYGVSRGPAGGIGTAGGDIDPNTAFLRQTYYEIIGVPPEAEYTAIKASYEAKINEINRDRDKKAAFTKRVAVTRAWEILKDPVRRREYDESTKAPLIDKMKKCPVCGLDFADPIPPICPRAECGWDLQNDLTLVPSLGEIPENILEEYRQRLGVARRNYHDHLGAIQKQKELEEELRRLKAERETAPDDTAPAAGESIFESSAPQVTAKRFRVALRPLIFICLSLLLLLTALYWFSLRTPALTMSAPGYGHYKSFEKEYGLLNGNDWSKASYDFKVSYIFGIGNMTDFTLAFYAKAEGSGPGFISILKNRWSNKTVAQVVKDIDNYYSINKDDINKPIIKVIYNIYQ